MASTRWICVKCGNKTTTTDGKKPSDEVIKAAYKALVKKYHSDNCSENKSIANKKIIEINEAFAVLSDKRWRITMKSPIYYNAKDIVEMLDVSKATAYSIIRKLNEELEAEGYLTLQGKVPRAYFDEKWYGMAKIS